MFWLPVPSFASDDPATLILALEIPTSSLPMMVIFVPVSAISPLFSITSLLPPVTSVILVSESIVMSAFDLIETLSVTFESQMFSNF